VDGTADDLDALRLLLLPADVVAAQPDGRYLFAGAPQCPVAHVAANRLRRPFRLVRLAWLGSGRLRAPESRKGACGHRGPCGDGQLQELSAIHEGLLPLCEIRARSDAIARENRCRNAIANPCKPHARGRSSFTTNRNVTELTHVRRQGSARC